MHVRLLDFDVMQMHHRIQRDDTRIGCLTYNLAMHLAAGGYIDHQVTLDAGGTGQPVSVGQGPPASELLFGGAQWTQVGGSRVDSMFGELAFHHQDLAPSAQCPTTTNRIHVNAERARRLKQGSSDRESSAFS
jgi:hypothetical protein